MIESTVRGGEELSQPERAAVLQAVRRAAGGEGRAIDLIARDLEVPKRTALAVAADALNMRLIEMQELREMLIDFDVVTFAEATRRFCLAGRMGNGRLCVVVADPFDESLTAWLDERVQEPFDLLLGAAEDLAAAITLQEESQRAVDAIRPALQPAAERVAGTPVLGREQIERESSPILQVVYSTMLDAMRAGASDIHLETGADGISIKLRIDGVLAMAKSVDGAATARQIISAIKVMAELDIAETRTPQDGRLKVTFGGREVDLRVSVMPNVHGEDVVLRILDKRALAESAQGLRLDVLGFDAETCRFMRKLSLRPHGMLLVTGPTGSGKTTTLYAAISEINRGEDKIITIEDPVEYELPGVLQIPVNEKKGLTFARGLRSILRHDPDKILVGEIRDEETAQIAVQSALTGHLVFTTVHANNAFDVIGRFTHMGIDLYNLVAALNGVVAQRLIRLVCPSCRTDVVPDPEELSSSGIDPAAAAGFRFVQGAGCGECRGQGYRGRRAIAETLLMTEEVKHAIVNRVSGMGLREVAARAGMRSLRDRALDLARHGETSLQEVNRVTAMA